MVISSGVITKLVDLVEPENRAKALNGWQLSLLLQGLLIIVFVVFLQESYAPILLERKARRMRKETRNPNTQYSFKAGLGEAPGRDHKGGSEVPFQLAFYHYVNPHLLYRFRLSIPPIHYLHCRL
ncbi:hypothetical protein F4821DRAFT_55544 [Hypoxylon rubiginosum]|uniref:Uncharacterized protein n=1 Tax=Hypoxylon rubiginosum TaxID=110542 RepID=A0ACC0DA36_9PEZI|nr:hypothetical protein F4821DRAFT_55544 [Hypoxylon rubiginosum]